MKSELYIFAVILSSCVFAQRTHSNVPYPLNYQNPTQYQQQQGAVVQQVTYPQAQTTQQQQQQHVYPVQSDGSQSFYAKPIRKLPETQRNPAEQTNSHHFVRNENQSIEDEDDIEHSDEDGLVGPDDNNNQNSWIKKGKKTQVPYYFDQSVSFTTKNMKKVQKVMASVGKKMNVTFKQGQHQTCVIKISTLAQCSQNIVNRQNQKYNEIMACIDSEANIKNEVIRATRIGLEVNRRMGTLGQVGGGGESEEEQDDELGDDESEDDDDEDDDDEEQDDEESDDEKGYDRSDYN